MAKIERDKNKLQQIWVNFLIKKGLKIKFSKHFKQRLTERFPEIAALTDEQIKELIIMSNLLFVTKKDHKPILVLRNKKMVFLICNDEAVVITVYRFQSKEYQKITGGNKPARVYKKKVKRKKKSTRDYLQDSRQKN